MERQRWVFECMDCDSSFPAWDDCEKCPYCGTINIEPTEESEE